MCFGVEVIWCDLMRFGVEVAGLVQHFVAATAPAGVCLMTGPCEVV